MIVTFSGVDVDKTSMTFTFDGVLIPSNVANATYDDTKKTLKFLITSAMTSKPGHNEILLNGFRVADGTSNAVALPFDGTRR